MPVVRPIQLLMYNQEKELKKCIFYPMKKNINILKLFPYVEVDDLATIHYLSSNITYSLNSNNLIKIDLKNTLSLSDPLPVNYIRAYDLDPLFLGIEELPKEELKEGANPEIRKKILELSKNLPKKYRGRFHREYRLHIVYPEGDECVISAKDKIELEDKCNLGQLLIQELISSNKYTLYNSKRRAYPENTLMYLEVNKKQSKKRTNTHKNHYTMLIIDIDTGLVLRELEANTTKMLSHKSGINIKKLKDYYNKPEPIPMQISKVKKIQELRKNHNVGLLIEVRKR